MTYQIQQCSPKASARIANCEYCNGNGITSPTQSDPLGDQCQACKGSGMDAVNVGISPLTGDRYPYPSMLVGQCFIVPFELVSEKTIRNRTSAINAIDERKFIVVKHTEFGCYEVARVK